MWFRTPHLPVFDWARVQPFAETIVALGQVVEDDPTIENFTELGYSCTSMAATCRAAGYSPETPRDVVAVARGLVLGQFNSDGNPC